MPYHTGISDLGQLTGQEFDAEAFRKVPLQVYECSVSFLSAGDWRMLCQNKTFTTGGRDGMVSADDEELGGTPKVSANTMCSAGLVLYLGLVNFKDSLWPVDGKELGREVPIPKGQVDFPRLVRKLKEAGYQGPMVIEREISGPQFLQDVRAARDYIEGLLLKEGA